MIPGPQGAAEAVEERIGALGGHVEDDPTSPEDFNSTIAHALGIKHDEEIYSPDGRPFTIGNGGNLGPSSNRVKVVTE